ncbi:MAG: HD domain-containing protein [Cyanobacteriota bacterium]|nr:HD domain-containing protein [Cyanobacteriota bacterium]
MALRFCKSRTYHDPLHGAISLDGGDAVEALLIRLIDTPAFQRLRRIRQLDTAYFTFHGAEGSRFTHSVGVLYIARRVFDRLASRYPELKPYRAVTLVAALLHDIGHGPFSHAGEDMFGTHHELWTRRIVQEDPQIAQLLAEFDPQLPQQIQQVFLKEFSLPLVMQLVSSQLDCDRLDYLMRDSLLTGAQYGHLDLDRIITVLDYSPTRESLSIPARKGLGAIEHYLVVRYFMYTQVYQHPKSLAARFVLDRLFRRVRTLFEQQSLTLDAVLSAWLKEPVNQLPLDLYLAADDGLFSYPFYFWSQTKDPILQDLARRYLNRDLFKARNISQLSSEQQQSLKIKLQQKLIQDNWDPDYYLGFRAAHVQGYTFYYQGILLETDVGLQEIATLSPLVNALVHTPPQVWLIFPRHYADLVESFLQANLAIPTRSPLPLDIALKTW